MADSKAKQNWTALLLGIAGSVSTFALQETLRSQEECRIDLDEKATRESALADAEEHLDLLLTRKSAVPTREGAFHHSKLWSSPQAAAWLDVLLSSLWPELLSSLVAALAPLVVNRVLNAYREAYIPSALVSSLTLAKLGLGSRSPFSIRAVHVAKEGAACDGELVLDLEMECLSSELDVQINGSLNDGISPLLRVFGLRKTDDSFLAFKVSDMSFVGTLRLRLSPSSRLAFVGFVGEPKVDLGISLAYHSKLGFERNLPLSALPHVGSFLTSVTSLALKTYASWPRFFAIDCAPSMLFGLPQVSAREAYGRLRITVLRVTGLPADVPKKLRVVVTTGLEMKTARTAPFDSFDTDEGVATWAKPGAAGGQIDADIFSPLGIDFATFAIQLNSGSLSGQLKLQTMGSGDTLFSFATASKDAFSALPCCVVSATKAAYEERFGTILPGRAAAPSTCPPPTPRRWRRPARSTPT
jgi:hypothetical protein